MDGYGNVNFYVPIQGFDSIVDTKQFTVLQETKQM